MHARIALLTAALSATATAQAHLAPRTTTLVDDSEPTSASSPECASRITSWTNGFPTAAPALEDALDKPLTGGANWQSIEGLCSFAAQLPSTVLSEFSTYNLQMYSYLSAHNSDIDAIATSCSADMGAAPSVITSEMEQLLTMYSSFSAGACNGVKATGSASATTTATKSGLTSVVSSTGSASADASAAASSGASASTSATTTASQNASPRETGMFAAAAVAMGVLGAAVAL
ncbi:hypothetical protein F5B19DRAFT_367180 [Rostrohypoxylon terebratum]|nr:hypothetical protein F5B19DRAFT_367180 [Rostrohypoxylon terebratum]